ncbi:hypothetical protein RN001_010645 [Aquatica leii]|uniref:DUF4806 domain-containing protein n=1 Tax=Aquatica leii TaxID=1421715 RepID=A0AAN7P6S9_9COLE|nr:hypothetical protein RN001_010645 [Aquatica leii]
MPKTERKDYFHVSKRHKRRLKNALIENISNTVNIVATHDEKISNVESNTINIPPMEDIVIESFDEPVIPTTFVTNRTEENQELEQHTKTGYDTSKLQIVLQMLVETQLILNHIRDPVQDPSQPLHEVMKCIPIDSADKLQSLELELNDPTSNNFLMLFMKKVGETNGREFVVRNLRKIFVDSFASKTSWCSQRNNIRFSNLKLIKLLQDVTDSIFKLTDKEFEKTASEWFCQSKQRTQRDEKNSSILNTK